MARKKSPTLTEAELRLMEVLWNRGESTVADVVQALSRKSPLAYSTVLTTLRILEEKKYVTHRKDGRAFIYAPIVDRKAARSNALAYLVRRFFDNSPELLVLNILESRDLDERELERLRKKVEDS